MAYPDDPGHGTRGAFRLASLLAIAILVIFIAYFAFGGRHTQPAGTEQGLNPATTEQAKPTTPPPTP